MSRVDVSGWVGFSLGFMGILSIPCWSLEGVRGDSGPRVRCGRSIGRQVHSPGLKMFQLEPSSWSRQGLQAIALNSRVAWAPGTLHMGHLIGRPVAPCH